MDANQLISELARLNRARETVRKSLCDQAMKDKLLAQIDEQEKKLGQEPSAENKKK